MQKPNFLKFFTYLTIGVFVYFSLVFTLLIFEGNAEPSVECDVSIHDFSDAVWYTTVTLTTVGYGDMTPVTAGGRVIGTIFIIFSLGIYGLLIGQFTSILNVYRQNKKLGMNGTNFNDHVVMIGWTDFGKAVTDQLVAAGQKVAIVTAEKDNIDIIQEYYSPRNVFVLFSDHNNMEMLMKVNIDQSAIVFVNLNDDTEKLVYILNLKKNFENLNYVVTLDNANLKNTFVTAGVNYAISKHEIASKLLASYIFEPDVATLSEDIMSFPIDEDDQDIKQYKIIESNPHAGRNYRDVFYDLWKETNAVLLGLVKKDKKGNRKLYKNPEKDIIVEKGDYLIMICNQKAEAKIENIFRTKEGRHA